MTTYCAMANLGIGYTPELEGRKLELEVPAQHGNNLVLRDNRTGEPIQQIYIAVITALVRAGIVTLNSIKNRS